MAQGNYKLVIIGGGAAAFAAAIKANDLGVETAMINTGHIGGTCVNVGCVPSKHLLEVGNNYYYPQNSQFRAVENTNAGFDFATAIGEKDELVGVLRQENYTNVLGHLKHVDLHQGRARFLSDWEVEVDGQTLAGEKFIIATGSRASVVSFSGIEDVDYLTNIEALSLRELPESMVIIGGRALGLEFAQLYAHFGTAVTVLQRSDRILPEEEPEISDGLRGYLEEEGIEIHTGVKVTRVAQRGRTKIVTATVGTDELMFEGRELLMATGVVPNTDYLQPKTAGIDLDKRGFVAVDKHLQTSKPHIWAAGDVINGLLLETVAAKEGATAAQNALEGAEKTIDYDFVPHAVFTSPQVASVGLTEAELMKRIKVCACRTVPMSQVPKARAINDTRGLIKMVIHSETTKIVGVHILAPLAADMIHEGTLAVKSRLTIDEIIDTVHVFPTASEATKLAAQAFKRDISEMSCCVE